MIRWIVLFVSVFALGACASTPIGLDAAPENDFLSTEQRSLRDIAHEGDVLFHEAGWVHERHGQGMRRIAGILLNGVGAEAPAPDAVQAYLRHNDLHELNDDLRLVYYIGDAERMVGTLLAVNRAGQAVIASDILNASTIDGDLEVLDRFIGDARQAVTLLSRLNDLPMADGGAEGELADHVAVAQNAFSGLSDMADALQARRAEMRNSSTG